MSRTDTRPGWRFIGEDGTFILPLADQTSHLYFPLAGESGMLSSITPTLHGDIKSNHYTFLTPPVSVEDLHNSRASRNFWVYAEGIGAWSAAGNSARQNAMKHDGADEKTEVEAGFLWHKLTRESILSGLRSEIVSFVPAGQDRVELMKVTITNTGMRSIRLTPTAAIPLYGRAADEIRDHRHVTSLLHRIFSSRYGIEVQPSLTFDERGHRVNKMTYSVFAAEGSGDAPVGFFPITEDFIGEGGSLDWPEAIVRNINPSVTAGAELEGYEAVAAIRFRSVTLGHGESRSYVIAMTITDDRADTEYFSGAYLREDKFEEHWEVNREHWKQKLEKPQFHTRDGRFDNWMKWVSLQPILRRVYGNSFLPHHDYGRGGRGWRDLWQDCLALLIMEPSNVRNLLFNNFAGVRIDGTNATIIGSKPGEFISDRNNIPRVWMDHGAWPFLTTLLYLHQSGDFEFLMKKQTYFKDICIHRCQEKDLSWTPESGNWLMTRNGDAYMGTILEHLLLQNLVHFFHVGEHNNIKLEGADWNDGFDMASAKGESVAFTALYGSNFAEMAELLFHMHEKLQLNELELAEEITILLDTLGAPVDYESPDLKQALLNRFYDACTSRISGRKVKLDIRKVAEDLKRKAEWIAEHLRKREWIRSSEGFEWFNGYYNNDGEKVEGDHPQGVRMTLTGQVFTIMGGIASDEQVSKITASVDRYLKDPKIGYRLNTRFGEMQTNLGRAFGFAFGHKENGAMFSHMSVMYANALYKRGFAQQGNKVLDSIYALCSDFDNSRIYPGIPEYINEKGRGMYHYLTGSASWLLLTFLTEVFGVRGVYGDLMLEPKLLKTQFDRHRMASVRALFAGKNLDIVYNNPTELNYGEYRVQGVSINGKPFIIKPDQANTVIPRQVIKELPQDQLHTVDIILA